MPYTIAEIRDKVASHHYNAELMLQHLLIRVEELEKEIDARPHRETWLSLKEELALIYDENHALRGMVANLLHEHP
jgi:hypothetical protein